MLELQDLTLTIKSKILLKDISAFFEAGQVHMIVGPNGAGKSTLMRSICGQLEYEKGQILYEKKPLLMKNMYKRNKFIGYMQQFFEGSGLLVKEVLELSLRKSSGLFLYQDQYEYFEKCVDEFGVREFLNQSINTLSGGQRQKIFLVATLMQQPKIVLLDEPISHLDPKNQIELLQTIQYKTKKESLITLVVMHDMQHALHYGDTLLMLKKGQKTGHKKVNEVTSEDMSRLYDVECELFWKQHHPFLFLGHGHGVSLCTN